MTLEFHFFESLWKSIIIYYFSEYYQWLVFQTVITFMMPAKLKSAPTEKRAPFNIFLEKGSFFLVC